MASLTPEQAIEALGIHQDHKDVFLALWELMREPSHREAELEKLRHSMSKINQTLAEAGLISSSEEEGVAALAVCWNTASNECSKLRARVKGLMEENQTLSGQMKSLDYVLTHMGIERSGIPGLWKLAARLEDAEDKLDEIDDILTRYVPDLPARGVEGVRQAMKAYRVLLDKPED